MSLIRCAGHGNLEKIIKLIKNGIDVNEKNISGDTALMPASIWGHFKIVKAQAF